MTENSSANSASDDHLLELENEHLREVNKQLLQELETAKSQCDESLRLLSEVETIHTQNAQLKQEFASIQSENEDLKKRLEICQQNHNELSERATSDRTSMESKHRVEIGELTDRLHQLQRESNSEIESLRSKLRQEEENSAKQRSENSSLKQQIDKLVNASKAYFGIGFSDIREVTEFYLHPTGQFPVKDEVQEQALEKKRKKLKKKYAEEVEARKKLELEVLSLRQAAEEDAEQHRAASQKLEQCSEEYAMNIRRLQVEHEKELAELKSQVAEKWQLKSIETQTAADQDLSESTGSVEAPKETSDSVLELHAEVRNLKSKLMKSRNNNNVLRQEIEQIAQRKSKAEKKVGEVSRQVVQLRSTITSLEKELEDSKLENQKNTLLLDKMRSDSQAVNEQSSMINEANSGLRQTMESQVKEIKKLCRDRDSLVAIVDRQNQLLEKLETNIDQRPPVVEVPVHEEEIEIHDWDYGPLPEQLKLFIQPVAENNFEPIDSRMKQIFAIVSKWIANIELSHETELRKAVDDYNDTTKRSNEFVAKLTTILDQEEFDYGAIVQAVSNMQQRNLELEQKLNTYEIQHRVVFDQETYDRLNGVIASLQESYKNGKAKLKQRKNELRQCKVAFADCQSRADQDRQKLREVYDETQKQLKARAVEIEKLQQENLKLHEDIETINKQYTQQSDNAQREFDERMAESHKYFKEFKEQAKSTIREQSEKIIDLETHLNGLTKTATDLKIQLKKRESKEAELKQRVQRAKRSNEELQLNIERILAVKCTEIEQQYASEKQELIERCEQNETIIGKMTEAAQETEETVKQLTSKNGQLALALEKAEMKIQSQIDGLERQKKLSEFQTRSQIIAAETKHSLQVQELTRKWEEEKRSMCRYLAEQFSPFFDPSKPFTDATFRRMVDDIKAEVQRQRRQEESIRKVLRLQHNDSTAAALTDLMFASMKSRV